MTEGNTWNQYQKLVLDRLERLNNLYERLEGRMDGNYEKLNKRTDENYKRLDKRMDALERDITTLKVKSGVWGLLGGAVPVMVALLVWFLKTAM